MHTDQQRSFFALAESLLLTEENANGSVLFVQSQVCCCYEVDIDEQRLSLQRRLHTAKQTTNAAQSPAREEHEQLVASLEKQLSDLDAQAPAPAAKVRGRACFRVCGLLIMTMIAVRSRRPT